ncbi:uncharacterized protein LOC143233957 isoform X2 [Tachypleus tridentatus]|uniref:uncharacterized protein LOC143233957 isoform X2 n=1 Tax=Tachypleus tridentatus TaxID=6853 RepID=UPI003FD14022
MPVTECNLREKLKIPIEHLDYSYIKKCENSKELENIIKVLRSGEEGNFPDLTKYCENQLLKVAPQSKLLRSIEPVLHLSSISQGQQKTLKNDLQAWEEEIKTSERKLQRITQHSMSVVGVLPPVRNSFGANNISEKEEYQKDKAVVSGFDSVKEKATQETKSCDCTVSKKEDKKEIVKKNKEFGRSELSTDVHIFYEGLSDDQRSFLAEKEKAKGNEAFRAHDYEEALMYFSRSIQIQPILAAYNNRAQTTLLRRGTAYKELGDMLKAKADFESVVQLQPDSKLCQQMLNEVNKKLMPSSKPQGKRMIIEEFDGMETESATITTDHKENSSISCNSKENVIIEELKEVDIKNFTVNVDQAVLCSSKLEQDSQFNTQSVTLNEKDNVENEAIFQPEIDYSEGVRDPATTIKSKHSTKEDLITVQKNFNQTKIISSTQDPMPYQSKIIPIEDIDSDPEEENFVVRLVNKPKKIPSGSQANEILLTVAHQENNNTDHHDNQWFPVNSFDKISEVRNTKDISECFTSVGSGNISEFPVSTEEYQEMSEKSKMLGISTPLKEMDLESESRKHLSPYEYLHEWYSEKTGKTPCKAAAVLKHILPHEFPFILGNKVDGEMLSQIIMAFDYMRSHNDATHAVNLLYYLCDVPRISTVALFLKENEKHVIQNLMKFMKNEENEVKTKIHQIFHLAQCDM